MILFLNQAFHQRALLIVRADPTQQQLGIGAQSGQRIAQLMHHQVELLALLIQLVMKLSLILFKTENAGQRFRADLQARVMVCGSAWKGSLLGTKHAQKQAFVSQGVPATLLSNAAQAGVFSDGRWQR